MFLNVFPLQAAHVGRCLLVWLKDGLQKSAKVARAPRWPQDGIREPRNGPKMTVNNPEMAPNMASVPVLRATAQAGYAKR
jgi:hypothetical protein